MKIKLDSIENLAKAHAGLGDHFKKMAAHHDDLAKAHGAHAAFMKGKGEAMADDDMNKGYFGKAAAHHEAMEKIHKAASADHAAMAADCADKAAGDELEKGAAAAGAGEGEKVVVDNDDSVNFGGFLKKQIGDVMGELGKTPDFKKMISDYVTNQVKEQLGKTIVPTKTSATGVVTDPKLELVPRPGQPLNKVKEETEELPAELAHWA